MIVLDTTILLYAVGSDHPLARPCRTLVSDIGDGRVRAATTVEVLQEFAHVRSRRRTRSDAVRLTRSFAVLLGPLLQVSGEDLEAGLRLFEQHDELGCFDAVLVAAARANGAAAVASADRGIVGLPDARVLDPTSDSFVDEARSLG